MDVRELVEELQRSECSPGAIEACLSYLRGLSCERARLESTHIALCSALLAGIQSDSGPARELLNHCGPAQTIRIAHSSASGLE